MARRRARPAALLAALLLPASADAQQLTIPAPVGFVNDFAEVIPQEQREEIRRIAEEVQAKSGGEVAVVTLPSLEGRSRDDVALQILREWGVGATGEPGDRRRHSGTVILIVPRETSGDGRGHSKIELGFGTNTFITAAQAGRIQDELMIPRFRAGDYGGGILAGVQAVALRYADHFDFELTGVVPQAQAESRGGGAERIIAVLLVLALMMIVVAVLSGGGGGRGGRRGRRGAVPFPIFLPFPMGGRHRGGFGGFGGGFGGFGGGGRGGFGGGGFGGFGGGLGGGGGAGRSW